MTPTFDANIQLLHKSRRQGKEKFIFLPRKFAIVDRLTKQESEEINEHIQNEEDIGKTNDRKSKCKVDSSNSLSDQMNGFT